MKSLKQYISEGLKIKHNSDIIGKRFKYCPESKSELRELIEELIKTEGNNVNLNCIDIKNIKNLSYLFYRSKFNGDISLWDVSHVTDFQFMFSASSFDGDLSNWDMKSAENFEWMFAYSDYSGKNGDIGNWDVSNVRNMREMFLESEFAGDLKNWKPESLKIKTGIFRKSKVPKLKLIPDWSR